MCDKCGKIAKLIKVPFIYLDRNDKFHPNLGGDYHQYYVCKKCFENERR